MVVRGEAESMPAMAEIPFETMLADERARLVRFCARLTGKPGVAEDLAQETLLEAWRNQQKLSARDLVHPVNRVKWLAAIARNVCLRWGRSHGRDLAHTLSATDEGESNPDLDELPASTDGLDVELERDELARLLDRALALLPPPTRAVLIERYIHESPHREIAERFGLSEDALVQRLYRGKLALRRVMETELNAEAVAYGLIGPQSTSKESLELATRIRCPICNKSRLVQDYNPATGRTSFSCPDCWMLASPRPSPLWEGLHNPKSILKRQLAHLGKYYWQAIMRGEISCQECGHPAQTRVLTPQNIPEICRSYGGGGHSISIRCNHCQNEDINSLSRLTIDVPESQQFWQQHPRMFWLPEREIDYAGEPALLSGFQSADDSARLDIIYQRETLHILGIHETTC